MNPGDIRKQGIVRFFIPVSSQKERLDPERRLRVTDECQTLGRGYRLLPLSEQRQTDAVRTEVQ